MPPKYAELVRRALRDHFRQPPFELLRYDRGSGPEFRFGDLEVWLVVTGTRSGGASALGHLALFDPLSRDLGPTIPEEDGGGREFAGWRHMLANQVDAWLVSHPGRDLPADERADLDIAPYLEGLVAEAERQVRAVRPPGWDELQRLVVEGGPASGVWPEGVALYLAVRGARASATDLLERAAVQEELRAAAVAATPGQIRQPEVEEARAERRRERLRERAAELRRFAAHMGSVPDRR